MHSLERTRGRYCLKELGWQGKMGTLIQLDLLLSDVVELPRLAAALTESILASQLAARMLTVIGIAFRPACLNIVSHYETHYLVIFIFTFG